jgi:Zn-dependent protease with chaperone function
MHRPVIALLVLAGAAVLLVRAVSAQGPTPSDAPRQAASAQPPAPPAPPALPPAPLTIGEDVITDYTLPPETLARAEALYRTRLAMYVVGTIYGFAILLALLYGRVAPRVRDLAERASRRRFVQALVFTPLFFLILDVLTLPVSIYGQALERRYGLSVQGWPSWFWDWTKGELIGFVIGALLIWGLYAILRRSPTRWWFYGWLGAIPVILLLVLIGPIFIAPLFNTFSPLEEQQPQLVPELEKVMARGGLSIERERMFAMQASEKVTTYNAYVTGIGASKRVVVWDNTSRDLRVPETMFVFGHEMGHYVLNHVWLSLAAASVGLLLELYLAYRLLGGLLAKYGARWQIRGVTDWASLPVLLLLLGVFSAITQPVGAAYSRYLEHQSDIYGLEVTHGLTPDSAQAAAHAFQKLGEKGLVYPNPHPLFVWWAFSHPPVRDRIRFAISYRPWDGGEPTRYVK